ncbi:MAG: nucleotidyltransferase family protein, partial [Gemmatimonadales bacterium]
MTASLGPVQIRRLLARTMTVALGGGPAPAQLLHRWANADAPDEAWIAALTWDGIGATTGWALGALELSAVAPPDVEGLAAAAYDQAREQCVRLTADLARLGEAFGKADIPAIALKGSALAFANVSPALGVRWMNDLDVLVPETRVQDAAWALESLGYVRAAADRPEAAPVFRLYHETFASPEGRPVEVHWRLGP